MKGAPQSGSSREKIEVKKDTTVTIDREETHISHCGIKPEVHIKKKPVYLFFKRTFDIICSLIGLLVLLLPLLIVALIIVIDSPGAAPIYVQERVGKNGRRFRFYKFRSMVPNAEKMLDQLLEKNEMEGPAFKMKDDPRITRFGRFIRKTSIDELPQL